MATGPSRLMRWLLPHEQPKALSIDHPALEDIAWAADEIERLRSLTTWQPIETAPRDGTRIIFWESGKKVKTGEWLPPEAGWAVYGWKCTHGDFHDPTHWLPLPTSPEADT